MKPVTSVVAIATAAAPAAPCVAQQSKLIDPPDNPEGWAVTGEQHE